MHCAKCGTDVGEDNSKFCFSCGSPLKAAVAGNTPAATQAAAPAPSAEIPAAPVEAPAPQPQPENQLRGRVLVYDSATGKGVVSSSGQRFEFNIDTWESDAPPALGMTVEIHKGADKTTFSPVDDTVIAKEKLNQLGAKVSQHGTEIATEWAQKIGKPILIGYGIFIAGMFFLPFVNVMFAKPTLYETFQIAGYTLFAWVAVASIALPQFWRDTRSYYAYAAPAVVLAFALFQAMSTAMNAASQAGMFFGGRAKEQGMSMIFDTLKNLHFEIGFWLVIASSIWLAYQGITKVKAAKQAA